MSSFPDKISDNLKHLLLIVPSELLHEVLEEHVAVLHQEAPDDLISGIVRGSPN